MAVHLHETEFARNRSDDAPEPPQLLCCRSCFHHLGSSRQTRLGSRCRRQFNAHDAVRCARFDKRPGFRCLRHRGGLAGLHHSGRTVARQAQRHRRGLGGVCRRLAGWLPAGHAARAQRPDRVDEHRRPAPAHPERSAASVRHNGIIRRGNRSLQPRPAPAVALA